MLSVLAIAAAFGPFAISDTTDNDTSQRSVFALQMDENPNELNILRLACEEGRLMLFLDLHDFRTPEWSIVLFADDHSDGVDPLIFHHVESRQGTIAYFGEPAELLRGVKDHYKLIFQAIGSYGKREAVFSAEGSAKALERVKQVCP